MTASPSFLKKIVPAYHLEPEQTPAFKVRSSMTIFPRLLVIQFMLPTVEIMHQFVSKLQLILEKGHREFQEMLAGHVPVQMGILKDHTNNDEPLLIISNVSSRPFRIEVIEAIEALNIQPKKLLIQTNAQRLVDLYMNDENLPRYLLDVVLGQLHQRQRFHRGQLDLVAAQAEIAVTPDSQEWYMPMTDSKHLNVARVLKTKAALDADAAPALPKRSNPYAVIAQIKKARVNQSTTGPTINAPPPQETENPWSDNDEDFVQTLNDSVEPVAIPGSSSATTPVTNIHIATSSFVALLEAVQGVCADALRFCRQQQSK